MRMPPAKPTAILALFAIACVALAALHPVRAADAAYVGTWGVDAEHCKTGQDQEGAPYVFRKDGYDQHEAHCTFKTVTHTGDEFKFTSECSVEGDVQSDDTVITVTGDTLIWGDGAGAPNLMRCK